MMPSDHDAAWNEFTAGADAALATPDLIRGSDQHGDSSARAARDEERVRREFWSKARRVAAKLPFAEDLLAAYYCAFDHATPLQVKGALVAALAYFVLPFDFVPDVLPLVGYTDDAAVLLTAMRLVANHIRDEHRVAARDALARMRSE